MPTSDRFSASARIDAPAARVYGIIADYRNGHPKIVPPRWFGPLEVERGGVGAGTVIRFTMTMFGKTQTVRGEVTEPEPGRVLVETYPETGITTSFTIESTGVGGADLNACVVTIATDLPRRPGRLGGLRSRLENFFAARLLRRVYAEELELLRACASGQASS